MSTVSSDFTATGDGNSLIVVNRDAFQYNLSGTYVGTCYLMESLDYGSTWQQAAGPFTTDQSSVEFVARGTQRQHCHYRFSCTAFTSGTLETSLVDVELTDSYIKNKAGETLIELKEDTVSVPTGKTLACITGTSTSHTVGTLTTSTAEVTAVGVGAKNGSTVAVVEGGNGAVHKSVFTLTSTPVPCVSVTSGNGVGGYKIYDFPEGYIRVLGCISDLSLAIGATKQADFTDGTPEGDIGIGSVQPANADALGTDATDDDMGTATAFTMSAFAATADVPSEAIVSLDGTSTAKDVNVNILIDAADIDDDTTSEVEVSGTVTLTWMNLGDFG